MNPDDLMNAGDYFGMDECELTDRRGETSRPFAGQGVWLTPYVSASILEAAGTVTGGSVAEVGRGITELRHAIAESVIRHNLTDPFTGADIPQFWGEPDNVALPAAALFFLYQLIVTGEAPAARPKGSSNGHVGTTTLPSSASKISSSPAVRRRPRNG